MAAFQGYWLPIMLLFVYMALVGSIYGVAINNVNKDNYASVKSTFTTIVGVSIVLVFLFTLLSLVYITAEPTVFPKFAILVMGSSLLLSLLSVSFSVLQVTSQ